jgi:hypothetical protein
MLSMVAPGDRDVRGWIAYYRSASLRLSLAAWNGRLEVVDCISLLRSLIHKRKLTDDFALHGKRMESKKMLLNALRWTSPTGVVLYPAVVCTSRLCKLSATHRILLRGFVILRYVSA